MQNLEMFGKIANNRYVISTSKDGEYELSADMYDGSPCLEVRNLKKELEPVYHIPNELCDIVLKLLGINVGKDLQAFFNGSKTLDDLIMSQPIKYKRLYQMSDEDKCRLVKIIRIQRVFGGNCCCLKDREQEGRIKYEFTSLDELINKVSLNHYYNGMTISTNVAKLLRNRLLFSGENLKDLLTGIAKDGNVFNIINKQDLEIICLGEDGFNRFLSVFCIIAYNILGDDSFPIYDESYPIYSLICGQLKNENVPLSINNGDFSTFIKDYNVIKELTLCNALMLNCYARELRNLIMLRIQREADISYKKSVNDFGGDYALVSHEISKRGHIDYCYDLLIPIGEYFNGQLSKYISSQFKEGDWVKRRNDNRNPFDSYEVKFYKEGKVNCLPTNFYGPFLAYNQFQEDELEKIEI